MTHQHQLYLEQIQKFELQVQTLNEERNSVSVGLGNGVVGLTVRDNHLRTVQVTIDRSKIHQLIEQLKMADLHLEFSETIDNFILNS